MIHAQIKYVSVGPARGEFPKINPVSQVLQEYSEMHGLQKKFLAMLQIPKGDTVQMLVRLSFTELPGPAPRHPVQSFIKV